MKIEFTNCKISIYENIILEDVSLEIIEGKFYRLIGGNGSGKTVLMNSLIGLHQSVKGQKVVSYNKKMMCYISDTAFFFDDDKVSDVINDICFFYDVGRNVLENLFFKMDMDLKFLKSKRVFELSQGMRKKLMISPIFLEKSKILFLDEIFTGLDKHTQKLLVQELIAKNEKKETIIIIEHNESIIDEIMKSDIKMEVFECKNKKVTKIS